MGTTANQQTTDGLIRVKVTGGTRDRSYLVLPEDKLEQRVKTLAQEHKGAPIPKITIKQDRLLYNSLIAHGAILTGNTQEQDDVTITDGKLSVNASLDHFGVASVKQRTRPQFIAELKQRFPKTTVEQYYKGELEPRHLKAVLNQIPQGATSDPLYRYFRTQVETAQRNTQKCTLTDAVKNVFDNLYPDLAKKYAGISLAQNMFLLEVTEQSARSYLRDCFLEGRDLGIHSLRTYSPVGGKVTGFLKQNKGQTTLFDNTDFAQRVAQTLNYGFDKKDVQAASGAQNKLSKLSEHQVEFTFLVAHKYGLNSSFERAFPGGIQSVLVDNISKQVHQEDDIYADARIVESPDLETLTEVKAPLEIKLHLVRRGIVEKYQNAHYWQDDTPIDNWVAFLNTYHGHVDESKQLLEDNGWTAVTAEEFETMYDQALQTLKKQDPNFWKSLGLPGVSKDTLQQINDVYKNRRSTLLRKSMQWQRDWMVELFHRAIIQLRTPQTYQATQQFQRTYLYELEHVPVIPNCLFYDLEDTGFSGKKEVINVLGMTYEQDGKMMLEQILVRNPMEEQAAVQRFDQLSKQFQFTVTYNGDTHDHHFLNYRMLFHGIEPNIPTSIDLYKAIKKRGMQNNWPKLKLKYTGRIYGDNRHDDDIPSGDIPQIYKNFIYGEGDSDLIKGILEHNAADLMAMPAMLADPKNRQYIRIPNLPKPSQTI